MSPRRKRMKYSKWLRKKERIIWLRGRHDPFIDYFYGPRSSAKNKAPEREE